MTIVKSLKDSSLLIKSINETTENEVKEQKEGLLSMLAAILGARLLEKMLGGTGAIQDG